MVIHPCVSLMRSLCTFSAWWGTSQSGAPRGLLAMAEPSQQQLSRSSPCQLYLLPLHQVLIHEAGWHESCWYSAQSDGSLIAIFHLTICEWKPAHTKLHTKEKENICWTAICLFFLLLQFLQYHYLSVCLESRSLFLLCVKGLYHLNGSVSGFSTVSYELSTEAVGTGADRLMVARVLTFGNMWGSEGGEGDRGEGEGVRDRGGDGVESSMQGSEGEGRGARGNKTVGSTILTRKWRFRCGNMPCEPGIGPWDWEGQFLTFTEIEMQNIYRMT